MKDLRPLYTEFREKPWPSLAGDVGDFPLYEALVVGFVQQFLNGTALRESEIPLPDEGTNEYVRILRRKEFLSQEEAAFLEYFELTEQIRSLLVQACRKGIRG